MKTKQILLAALCGLPLAAPSFAQQVPIALKPVDVTAAAHGVIMHPEYAKTIGRIAYVWGLADGQPNEPPRRDHPGAAAWTAQRRAAGPAHQHRR